MRLNKTEVLILVLAMFLPVSTVGQVDVFAGVIQKQPIHGKVAGVNRDHSLVIQEGDKMHVFHLYGLIFPTGGSGLSKISRSFLEQTTFGKRVKVQPVAFGPSRRNYALVFLEALNVNEEMVREGMAWVIPRGCNLPECESLLKAQEEAKAFSRGIWAAKGITPPWERGGRKKLR